MDELIKRYEEVRNDIHEKVLEYLIELDTKKYIFEEEIYYNRDYLNPENSIKIIFVEFNNMIYDGSCLDRVIELGLSNGKSIELSDLKFNTFTIYFILNALRAAVIYKDKKSVFDCKLRVESKDIIITDPCYIIKENYSHFRDTYINYQDYNLIEKNGWDKKNLTMSQVLESYRSYREYDRLSSKLKKAKEEKNDWRNCHYGERMDLLGINNCLISDTLYGDWSCTTFNSDTKEPIGNFCADAGMVGVFLLDEVLTYNPDFDLHINKPHTTTLIKNFTGEIWIEKRHNEGVYESTTEYHKAGDKWEDDSIHVLGSGSINFITKQTGL